MVAAEVLYTSLGMPLFSLQEAELQRACFRTFNDWLVEFSSYNPKLLYGNALISLEDVGEGVKELERCAKLRLRGGMIGRAFGKQIVGIFSTEKIIELGSNMSKLNRC
jgi:predicted TIM-barrel fold metal-dependent hydrolase